ncbi:uncharacterized protein SPPG_00261 [Spizellomyces punctatus DAOM BR117]|uniref:Pyrroloquinoline quinone-dependent pyranose dehydrogenase beta-propeller domain-containing protein n=1 Tax=Spizellomyces punctatus (strain DAOM BR117) TaxID=645134 RepID=A0A0L0HT57_SPIPD|nr:uncharacterized protein SPPG_00261 [Spizellomyces punctatus DAOM BR117]KND04536.1 hypothetical protein SPPG_00261 [Spizellomyces punctatus DAOM BR117]|eukprot:XP_016612575.1 hypothetical protein SPPG_00261 [Spizellomyces punctatus DAOM BR117]
MSSPRPPTSSPKPSTKRCTNRKSIIISFVVSLLLLALILGLSLGLTRPKNNDSTGTPMTTYSGLQSAKGSVDLVASRLTGVRSLLFDRATGKVLSLVRGKQQVVAIAVVQPSTADFSQNVILDVSSLNIGLNHGMAIHEGYIYASSASSVYRWKYSGQPIAKPGEYETFVSNIDSGFLPGDTAAGHITRTILLDSNWLYISVGSLGNVDPTPFRSRIRRVPYKTYNSTAFNFQTAEVFADGVRNAVAMAFDSRGKLWTAVNGPDNLARPDIGNDIVQDSPIEPIYLLEQPGRFYGYPYCFTLGNVSGSFATDPSVGTQYAWPDSMNDGTHTDAWCRDPANVVTPSAMIQAHSAPLDMEFGPSGMLYVALHGSWNRNVPAGYSIVRLPFKPDGSPTVDRVTDRVLWLSDQLCPATSVTTCFRPAGLAIVDKYVYVSSDATGEIVRFEY